MTTSHQAIRAAVDVKAHAPCPMCGQQSWVGGDRLTEIGNPPIDTIPFVCTHCGYLRLHAVQALETLDD